MEPIRRVTPATLDVLAVLLNDAEPVWGLKIIKASGRLPGTVYPILERLHGLGWVSASWEDTAEPGPRRRFYRLTRDGAAEAARLLASRAHSLPSATTSTGALST